MSLPPQGLYIYDVTRLKHSIPLVLLHFYLAEDYSSSRVDLSELKWHFFKEFKCIRAREDATNSLIGALMFSLTVISICNSVFLYIYFISFSSIDYKCHDNRDHVCFVPSTVQWTVYRKR